MASIWPHPDSKFYFACYRAADGRRLKVSTKTADKEEAQRVADRLELEARDAKAKRKEGSSLNGINDTLRRGMQKAQSGRLDESAAWELVNDLMRAAGSAPLNRWTARGWFEAWKKSKAGAVKDGSRVKYDQVSRDWLDFLGDKADKPLELATKTEAVGFRDRMAGDGLSPRTVNQTVKLVRGVYADAVEQGHIGRNPFAGVDRVREANAEKRGPFSPADVAELVKAAEGDWRGLVLLAATSGLRLMDAARLTWGALSLPAAQLTLRTAKTGAVITLPLHPAFSSWLAEQPRGIAKAPVFPSLAHKSGTGKSGLSMAFRKLMEKAKIEAAVAREKQGTRGRAVSTRSFHSLRHFAASQMAQAGVRSEIAQQITGHSDAETHAGYVTPDMAALRKAVGKIKLSA